MLRDGHKWKLSVKLKKIGSEIAQTILRKLDYEDKKIEKINHFIVVHRFRTGNEPKIIEAKYDSNINILKILLFRGGENMYRHAPKDYICPFCLIVNGVENEHVLTKQHDIVYKDNYITAFIGAGWWNNNKGHVIIIPNKHFENIYELPNELSVKIHEFEKEIAIAFKEVYKCDGVSSRQHNEPCGNQDVWHYHLHVFPRYKDDNLYLTGRELSKPEERLAYAEKLRNYFNKKNKK